MTEEEFWSIIESTRKNRCEEHSEALTKALTKLPAAEIEDYSHWFETSLVALYRWDIWGAVYVIAGGCSDDWFDYFRFWVIGQGESVFRAVLEDPESLGDLVDDDDIFCELLSYADSRAYHEVTGRELVGSSDGPKEPSGEAWDEEDLEMMFPKLAAKFDFISGGEVVHEETSPLKMLLQKIRGMWLRS